MDKLYKITVFTPTYNRGYIIGRLFESLCIQTFHDFEWLVVDDGSSDNTEEILNSYIKKANFPIRYIKQENGGKHRAINTGVKYARGELFFIVDSDDYILENALELISKTECTIPQNEKFSGIRALRGYDANTVIGTKFPCDYKADLTMLQETKLNVTGDKCEAFYTNVMRKFPFPEYEGEKFLTECVVWDKMAASGYKNRCINEIIYITEYLNDGLTSNKNKNHHDSPKGTGLYIFQSIKYKKIKGWEKRYKVLNYYLTQKDYMNGREIANNLHRSYLSLLAYIKYVKVRVHLRQKMKGLLRRIKIKEI